MHDIVLALWMKTRIFYVVSVAVIIIIVIVSTYYEVKDDPDMANYIASLAIGPLYLCLLISIVNLYFDYYSYYHNVW